MKKTIDSRPKILPEPKKVRQRRFSTAGLTLCAVLCMALSILYCQPVFTTTDVWTKAREIMQDVYNQIVLISTVAAIVTASVALLMMNFSRSGKTVDESRAWLKRIYISWIALNVWLLVQRQRFLYHTAEFY